MAPDPHHTTAEKAIRALASARSQRLAAAIASRLVEMRQDSNTHFLIYNALGISDHEAAQIDTY